MYKTIETKAKFIKYELTKSTKFHSLALLVKLILSVIDFIHWIKFGQDRFLYQSMKQ